MSGADRVEHSYFTWKGTAFLCGDCVRSASLVVDGSRVKETPTSKPFVCDSCHRRIIPGGEPVEPLDVSKLTPALALRWEVSSQEAIRRMSDRSEFASTWRPATYWPGAIVEEPPDSLADDLLDGEVEIARLHLPSGLGNMIGVRARRVGAANALRAVDEYEQELSLTPGRISEPLSHQELLSVVKSLEWTGPTAFGPVWWTRELESEIDTERAAEFITGSSETYPLFEALIDEDNAAWLEARYAE
jgi:hypothetical protein